MRNDLVPNSLRTNDRAARPGNRRMNGLYWTTRAVRRFAVIAVVVLVADVPLVRGERIVLDDFEHPDNWSVIASDGVDASIAPTAGARGRDCASRMIFARVLDSA